MLCFPTALSSSCISHMWLKNVHPLISLTSLLCSNTWFTSIKRMSTSLKNSLYSLASSEEQGLFHYAAHCQITLNKYSSTKFFTCNFKYYLCFFSVRLNAALSHFTEMHQGEYLKQVQDRCPIYDISKCHWFLTLFQIIGFKNKL